MATPLAPRSTLAAVDTNFLLDLAVPKDRAHDAVEIFRRRVPGVEFVVPPTVIDELDYIAHHGDTAGDRALALTALQTSSESGNFGRWTSSRSDTALSKPSHASCAGKN